MKLSEFLTLLDEGVYDKAVLKAIFLAGGPGAGKSTIAARTTGGLGFKVLNSDQVAEYLWAKHGKGVGSEFKSTTAGLPVAKVMGTGAKWQTSPTYYRQFAGFGSKAGTQILKAKLGKLDLNIHPDEYFQPERTQAKADMEKLVALRTAGTGIWADERMGLIIDATSDELDKIKNQRAKLISLGYDCIIIFVNTTLETSLRRNMQRARTVAEPVVTDIWKKVQYMAGKRQGETNKYRELFGAGNYFEINNDRDIPASADETAKKIWVKVMNFVQRPVQNPIGKKWISDQLSLRRR